MSWYRVGEMPLFLILGLWLCIGCNGGTPRPELTPSGEVEKAPSKPIVTWSKKPSDRWLEIDKLRDAGQFAQALEMNDELLEVFRKEGDAPEWTRALLNGVVLRSNLGKFETAVNYLLGETGPEDLLSHVVLNLFKAQTFMNYMNQYGWEIRKREKVQSKGIKDLKLWTRFEINEAVEKAFHSVWTHREQLGEMKNEALESYLKSGNYPRNIKTTLRDAAVFLWARHISDSGHWKPEEQSRVYAQNLKAMLSDNPGDIDPGRLDIHPIRRLARLYADLELWHSSTGRKEAALEAYLARQRALAAHFLGRTTVGSKNREHFVQGLKVRLAEARDVPWWAVGMHWLATLHNKAGSKVDAVRTCDEAIAAYPKSIGAQRCTHLVMSLKAPGLTLEASRLDGAQQRSIGLNYQNLERVNFRAWKLDVAKRIAAQKDESLIPGRAELRRIIDERKPAFEWNVGLPTTKDLKTHRAWVVPPMKRPGTYLVAVSDSDTFKLKGSKERAEDDYSEVRAVIMTISDLVLSTKTTPEGIELYTLSGVTGQPVPGTRVRFYDRDSRVGFRRVVTKNSDDQGRVVLTDRWAKASGLIRHHRSRLEGLVAVAEHRGGLSFHNGRYVYGPQEETDHVSAALIYTDRPIYRPGQTVHWQVSAFGGRRNKAKFRTLANHRMSVQLRDANYEVVKTIKAKTNAFGTAAGTFEIPAGRGLGSWQITTDLTSTTIMVEEYKRPTFEVKMLDAERPYRLNESARIQGEVRYYFGLPVTAGKVSWRVERVPVFPRWWHWFHPGSSEAPEVVARGTSPLDGQGRFELSFTPEADPRLAQENARAVSYRYAVTADVTDEGGETRHSNRTFRLGFVSVETHIESRENFFVEGEPLEFDASRTDLNGVGAAGTGHWRVTVLQQPTNTLLPHEMELPPPTRQGAFYTPDDLKVPRWKHGYKGADFRLAKWKDGATVASGSLNHDAEGLANVNVNGLSAGAYRLHYETEDPYGQTFKTQQAFVVVGSKTPLAVPLSFKVNRSAFKVGESARVFIHSGFDNQPLYFSRWRDGKQVSRTQVSGNGREWELPITEADRGGFVLAVSFLRDHQWITIHRNVHVGWDNKKLKVSFETFRDTLRPGQKEVWRVKVSAPDASSAAAEVLAYMYDRSLDAFGRPSRGHRGMTRTFSRRRDRRVVSVSNPLGLYPSHQNHSSQSNNLGQGETVWLGGGDFGVSRRRPSFPRLDSYRLKFGPMGQGRGGRMQSLRSMGSISSAGVKHFDFAEAEIEGDMVKKSAKVKKSARKRPEVGIKRKGASDSTKAPGQIRSNFAETAFFQPQLRTGKDGSVTIEFEVPDSVTSWNVYAHAITRDLSYGVVKKEVRTVKDLMVRPYVPRFMREGDLATLQVVVNNASAAELKGHVDFDIIDPETKHSRLEEFGLTAEQAQNLAFTAEKGASARLSLPIKVPATLGQIAVKVTARTENFSDGEVRPIPILPGRVHLAQSRFAALKGAGSRTLRFDDLSKDDDPTRMHSSMVVTLDGQLFYGVLAALPYLVNYPYECTEQTLNRFLSTGILSSLYGEYPAVAKMARTLAKRDTRLEPWDGDDANRKIALEETPWLRQAQGGHRRDLLKVLDPKVASNQQASALDALRKVQRSDGAFPWFAGGSASPFMTLYILHGFAKALEFGVEVPEDITRRAWAYVKRVYIDDDLKACMKTNGCWTMVTFLNYIVSMYPDEWTNTLFSKAYREELLDYSFTHWQAHSTSMKAYLAQTLKRMDRDKDATLVWTSVMDSATQTEDQGTFWAPEDRSWLWYNDTIEGHARALRATMELTPDDPKLDGLVLWLFMNKKLNHWKSTRATAEVIYALAHYLKSTKLLGIREETTVKIGELERAFVFEPDEFEGTQKQWVIDGKELKQSHAQVQFHKKSPGYQLASATWHFSTEKMPTEARGDFLQVRRRYFRRTKTGQETVLEPLEEGAVLSIGDEVEIQLSLRSKHAMEYVQLRDPRGAGFEPVSNHSRYRWDLGIAWYEEVRDSGTNFFFESLPHGEYTFKYRLRANMAGVFKVGPAVLQGVYAPEFVAYSEGHELGIEASNTAR